VPAPHPAIDRLLFGIFLGAAALFAHPVIASAIYAGTHVLVQLVLTPLLAGWAIWVGIAVSARSTDVRAAQQLSVLASAPPLVVLALMSLNVITASTVLALGLAAALLTVGDCPGHAGAVLGGQVLQPLGHEPGTPLAHRGPRAAQFGCQRLVRLCPRHSPARSWT
jgi:hypothetical protein